MTQMPDPALVPEWTLGWRLQRALAHAGLSVPEMAEKLGVARQSVRRWATDLIIPKPIYIKEMALICGVPYEWLAYGETGPTPGPGTMQGFAGGRLHRSLQPVIPVSYTLISRTPLTAGIAA